MHIYAQINHEQFHRMLDEYREAKRRELDLELKAKQYVLMASLRTPSECSAPVTWAHVPVMHWHRTTLCQAHPLTH